MGAQPRCHPSAGACQKGNAAAVSLAAGGGWATLLCPTLHPTQAEACDSAGGLKGIIMVHSLGGGTGSGLGSRLMEVTRDEFARWVGVGGAAAAIAAGEQQHRRVACSTASTAPLLCFLCLRVAFHLDCSTPLISCCVAPFTSGDTPLQHYNMVLSLATAQECSDAIMLFENDDLMARAKLAARTARMYTAAAGGAGMAASGTAGGGGATAAAMARAAARASRTGRAIDGSDVRITTADVNDVAGEAAHVTTRTSSCQAARLSTGLSLALPLT